jgi:hypothetical protein
LAIFNTFHISIVAKIYCKLGMVYILLECGNYLENNGFQFIQFKFHQQIKRYKCGMRKVVAPFLHCFVIIRDSDLDLMDLDPT